MTCRYLVVVYSCQSLWHAVGIPMESRAARLTEDGQFGRPIKRLIRSFSHRTFWRRRFLCSENVLCFPPYFLDQLSMVRFRSTSR